jgi:hypothetical protein
LRLNSSQNYSPKTKQAPLIVDHSSTDVRLFPTALCTYYEVRDLRTQELGPRMSFSVTGSLRDYEMINKALEDEFRLHI